MRPCGCSTNGTATRNCRFGMAADDGVTYIVVVQETAGEAVRGVGSSCCAAPALHLPTRCCSRVPPLRCPLPPGAACSPPACPTSPAAAAALPPAAGAAAAAAQRSVRAPPQRVLRLGHHRLGVLHGVSMGRIGARPNGARAAAIRRQQAAGLAWPHAPSPPRPQPLPQPPSPGPAWPTPTTTPSSSS